MLVSAGLKLRPESVIPGVTSARLNPFENRTKVSTTTALVVRSCLPNPRKIAVVSILSVSPLYRIVVLDVVIAFRRWSALTCIFQRVCVNLDPECWKF